MPSLTLKLLFCLFAAAWIGNLKKLAAEKNFRQRFHEPALMRAHVWEDEKAPWIFNDTTRS